jgi:hypothetical protein
MCKALRLFLGLIVFVPTFALPGALAGLDPGEHTAWSGLVAAAAMGLFFGLGFTGLGA